MTAFIERSNGPNQRRRKNNGAATAYPQFASTLAILGIDRHQSDPESGIVVDVNNLHSKSKRKKPNKTLVYLRNRTRATLGNAAGFLIGVLLIAITTHRIVSLFESHRKWINAPITYVRRPCPAIEYENLREGVDAGKICITSLTDQKSPSRLQRFIRWRNFDGILDLTWPNKEAYAEKYGYHLFDGSRHIDHSRPPAWSKIKAVKYLLEIEHCDWVMWTDADTLIMNSHVRIQDFLPADSTKDMLVGSDKGGGFNSGVFLFRNTQWSLQILDDWWNMKQFVRPPGLSLSGDNSAMKSLLKNMEDLNEHVLSPPRCTFNSFAKFLTLGQSRVAIDHLDQQSWYLDDEHYHTGDFIAHTPGVNNKIECLRLLLPEAK